MTITGPLVTVVLNYAANQSADRLVGWIKGHYTDPGKGLRRAVGRANDRAWLTLAQALGGDGSFTWLGDLWRGAGWAGLRDAIRQFLEVTPAGLEACPDRGAAGRELAALLTARKLAVPDPEALLADVQRYGSPAGVVADLERAAGEVADRLEREAPALAAVLRLSPPGGPLVVQAFRFFFRAEVRRNKELAADLAADALDHISTQLDARTEGILDQVGHLHDAVDDIRQLLGHLIATNGVPTGTHQPLRVTVKSLEQQEKLRRWLAEWETLPPDLLGSADWLSLGDALTAARLLEQARAAQESAARAAADRAAEAEARYKAYRVACEQEDWEAALPALVAAAELLPERYEPFPVHRYAPVRLLGSGGFGAVALCRDTLNEDAPVAVKVFHPTDGGRTLKELFGEALTGRALKDPGIVEVIHWDFADRGRTRPYLVMEFFDGVSLAAHLKRHGPLAVADFLPVARQVAESLRAAHAAGVLHRDIKPGNVLVKATRNEGMPSSGWPGQSPRCPGSEDTGASRTLPRPPEPDADSPGTVWDTRLIDFGLAVRFAVIQASVSTDRRERTRQEESFAGTYDYASPEQKKGGDGTVGPRSDVYSFGKTMLEALIGPVELTNRAWAAVPAEYRDGLRDVLERCVETDPADRHAGFGPIVEALKALDPAERAARGRAEAEAKRLAELAELAVRTAAAKEAERAAEVERLRQAAEEAGRRAARQQADQERADNLTLWQASGMARAWVANHLDGWDHAAWTELIGTLKKSTYWPLDPAALGAHLEAVRGELRAVRDAERAETARREAARLAKEKADAEAKEKAARDAILKDPFHPARPRQPGDTVKLILPGDVPMAFAWCPPSSELPGGYFLMGSNHPEGNSDEKPVRKVTLSKGFYMAVTPVTQAQWQAVMGADNPSHFKGPNRPVESIDWKRCHDFCDAVKRHTGRAVRLPSEAEWEYACRAGTTTEYHFGDRINADLVNYDANHTWNGSPKGTYRQQTTDVKSFPANDWKLHDMHGNVWE